MRLLRRLRGTAVIASVWALAWLPVGIPLGLAFGWLRWPLLGAANFPFLAFWTGIGFLSGTVFSALLAMRERNRTVEELSSGRVALWGVLGGATVPVLSSLLVLAVTDLHLSREAGPVFLAMAALGGGCAYATLWLARRSTASTKATASTL